MLLICKLVLVFKSIEKRNVYSFKSFKIVEEQVLLPSGEQTSHLTLEHPGAVVILPKIDSNTILMIKQYRHSIGKEIFELPAGTLNVSEGPLGCAKRELIEETNFTASSWRSLGEIYPAPGFCNEIQYLFLAEELEPDTGLLDEDEVIEVCHLKTGEVFKMAENNQIMDGKTLACLLKAKLIGAIT